MHSTIWWRHLVIGGLLYQTMTPTNVKFKSTKGRSCYLRCTIKLGCGWLLQLATDMRLFLLLVGTHDLRTLWNPLVSLNQDRHTKAQSSLLFFIFLNLNLLFLKSPQWNLLLVDLITATLFLFKFSSLLCPPPPLLSLATAHRFFSRPCSTRAGNQRTAVPVPPVQGTRELADLLWRTRPDTRHDGPNRPKSGSPELSPIGLLWRTRAPSRADGRT